MKKWIELVISKKQQGRCLYTCYRQNLSGCELVLEGAHYHRILMSQHCGFMFTNFMFSRTLIF